MPSSGGDSTHWKFLTDAKSFADKPRWSPDGKLLYYLQAERGVFNVWAQRLNSETGTPIGAPVRVTSFDSPSRHISPNMGRVEPSVSSSRLILPIREITGNIWVLPLDGAAR